MGETQERLGKTGGRRRRGRQRMKCLDGITDSMDMDLSKQTLGDREGQGSLGCCSPWGCNESDMTEEVNSARYTVGVPQVFMEMCVLFFSPYMLLEECFISNLHSERIHFHFFK